MAEAKLGNDTAILPGVFPQTPEVSLHQFFISQKCCLLGYHNDFYFLILCLCHLMLCQVLLHPKNVFTSLIHYRKSVPEGFVCEETLIAIDESLQRPGMFNI